MRLTSEKHAEIADWIAARLARKFDVPRDKIVMVDVCVLPHETACKYTLFDDDILDDRGWVIGAHTHDVILRRDFWTAETAFVIVWVGQDKRSNEVFCSWVHAGEREKYHAEIS